MSTIYTRVSRVAIWAGWCSPCQREDRPLMLTRSGPGGLRSWLAGLSDEDRVLLLTCRVCGGWQFVPAREEDDPEVVCLEDALEEIAAARKSVDQILQEAREAIPAHAAAAIAPQPAVAVAAVPTEAAVVEAAVQGAVVEPPLQPAAAKPTSTTGPVAAEAAVPADAAAGHIPEPRRPVPRIVTVPDAVPAPGFSPEVVAAAARVLAAARAQTQRTAVPAGPRPAALDRSRPKRLGPTPRRSERPGTVRVPAAAPATPAAVPATAAAVTSSLPALLGLPAQTRSVIVAACA